MGRLRPSPILVLAWVLGPAFSLAACPKLPVNCSTQAWQTVQDTVAVSTSNSSQQQIWSFNSQSCYLKPRINRVVVQQLELSGDVLWQSLLAEEQPALLDLALEVQGIVLLPESRLRVRGLSLLNVLMPDQRLVNGKLAPPAPLVFNMSSSASLVMEDVTITTSCANLAQFVGWLINANTSSIQVLDSGRTVQTSYRQGNVLVSNATFCCTPSTPSTTGSSSSSSSSSIPVVARASAHDALQLYRIIQVTGQLQPVFIATTGIMNLRDAPWPLDVTIVPSGSDFSITISGPPPPASRQLLDFEGVGTFLSMRSGATLQLRNIVMINSCAGLLVLDTTCLPAVRLANIYNLWNVHFVRSFRSLSYVNVTSLGLEHFAVHSMTATSMAMLIGQAFPRYSLFASLVKAQVSPNAQPNSVPGAQLNRTSATFSSNTDAQLASQNASMALYQEGPEWAWMTPRAPKPLVWCNPDESGQDATMRTGHVVEVVDTLHQLSSALSMVLHAGSNPDAVYWSTQGLPFVVQLNTNMSLLDATGMMTSMDMDGEMHSVIDDTSSSNSSSGQAQPLDIHALLAGPLYSLYMETNYRPVVSLNLSGCAGCMHIGPGGHLYIMNLHLIEVHAKAFGSAPLTAETARDGSFEHLGLPLWAFEFNRTDDEPRVHLANLSVTIHEDEYRALLSLLLQRDGSGKGGPVAGFTSWKVASGTTSSGPLVLERFETRWGVNGTNVTLLPTALSGNEYLHVPQVEEQDSKGGELAAGGIVGVLGGSVLGALLLAAAAALVWKKRAKAWRADAAGASKPGPASAQDADAAPSDHKTRSDVCDMGHISSDQASSAMIHAPGTLLAAFNDRAADHSIMIIDGTPATSSDAQQGAGGSHMYPGSSSPPPTSKAVVDPHSEVQRMVDELNGGGGEAGRRLELLQPIGRGAFGTVYRGLWCGMEVAVKTLLFLNTPAAHDQTGGSAGSSNDPTSGHNPEDAGGSEGALAAEQHRQDVLREAAVCCSVRHENVVMTYHYEIAKMAAPVTASARGMIIRQRMVEEHKLYLIQELCDCSLSNAISHGLYHWPDGSPRLSCLLPTLADIIEGLAYLHSRNIVHGDIKAGNVVLKLVSREGEDVVVSKLTDFGLCETMGPDKTHVSNYGKGTPYYVAPEVMQQHQVTKASDIYSYGVLAWCLICKHQPFVVENGRHMPHPDFPTLPPTTPPELSSLVAGCLAGLPEARPTALGVRDRLWTMAGAPWYPRTLGAEQRSRREEVGAVAAAVAMGASVGTGAGTGTAVRAASELTPCTPSYSFLSGSGADLRPIATPATPGDGAVVPLAMHDSSGVQPQVQGMDGESGACDGAVSGPFKGLHSRTDMTRCLMSSGLFSTAVSAGFSTAAAAAAAEERR